MTVQSVLSVVAGSKENSFLLDDVEACPKKAATRAPGPASAPTINAVTAERQVAEFR